MLPGLFYYLTVRAFVTTYLQLYIQYLSIYGSYNDVSTYWNIRQDHGFSTFVGTSDTINFQKIK